MTITFMLPFSSNHAAIIIGKGGSTISQLQIETGCFIQVKRRDPKNGRPMPFVLIQGPNEKSVNQATIRVQGLIIKSMMAKETTQASEINDLGQQNQFLELKIADREEELKKLNEK